VKGFILDDERLKNPDQPFDYFDELMRRIQDIRTSERRFYQKITDIYATSIDYDPTQEVSLLFFTTVQNKVHWAITRQTAAEIVHGRVDAAKPNLGLTNWRGAVIRKQDVSIAKNYLSDSEMGQMQRIVSAYLDMAEMQAMRKIPMTMEDWEKRLSGFLQLWDHEILQDAGRVTAELSKAHAESEFEKYRIVQDRLFESDFDRLIKELPPEGEKP
jgi:hypothetical protein